MTFTQVAVLYDGTIVSFSQRTLKLWSPIDGRCLRTFGGISSFTCVVALPTRVGFVTGAEKGLIEARGVAGCA